MEVEKVSFLLQDSVYFLFIFFLFSLKFQGTPVVKISKSFMHVRLLQSQRLTVLIEFTCESIPVNLAAAAITVAVGERLSNTVFSAGLIWFGLGLRLLQEHIVDLVSFIAVVVPLHTHTSESEIRPLLFNSYWLLPAMSDEIIIIFLLVQFARW